MNNQNTVLVILAVLIIGGIVFYVTTDRWHMGRSEASEIHDEMMGHHDDAAESHEIYPGDVAEMMRVNKDIILLDVRTPEEYEEIHLTGATLLPVQQLSQQSLNEIGLGEDMKDKEIYLYCRSGSRSQTAYSIMESLGYSNIKSIAGGMIHWEEDDYPFTESGVYQGGMIMHEDDMTMEDSESPQIIIDRTTHDFGVIPQYGGTVETAFIVMNKGEDTLEMGDITTSCSCTSATILDSSIEPGESTTLTVIFDPDFHEEPLGVFKRTVFIPTNDPQNPEAEVSITVDIAEGQ